MKIDKLKEIFKNFYCNNDRAILIDGVWGVGKTHTILEFLESLEFCKTRVPFSAKYKYVSLFGKSNIDEIHTEIYRQFHPNYYKARKALNVIPKIAVIGNFLPGTAGSLANKISSLQFSLNVSRKSPVKDKSESTTHQIVFLDDFERIDFEKISFNDLLGYFNELIAQGIKLIVIYNSKRLLEKYKDLESDFVNFKEKIFDREYKITATEREVILSYFSEDSLIDESIINEFNNNLRLAQRTSIFYEEIKQVLKSKDINIRDDYEKRKLLKYCTYVIVETHSNIYKKISEKKEKDNIDFYDNYKFYLKEKDNNIEDYFKHIFDYINFKEGNQCTDCRLLSALLQFYFYRNEQVIYKLYVNEKGNIFNEEPILLSDEGKQALFLKQIKHILNGESLDNVNLNAIIYWWYKYADFSDVINKEKAIIDSFIKNLDKYQEKINYLIETFSFYAQDDFKNFVSELNKQVEEVSLDKLLNELKKDWENKNYESLLKKLHSLEDKQNYFTDNTKSKLNPAIEDFFKKSNYFINDLIGEISISQWHLANTMVLYSSKFGFQDELKKHIKALKSTDKSSAIRYETLLKSL
ncbi:MAG: hypothetical protein HFE41_02190 [Clostridia bacterium]|nr:hypothetical protein [Clostridia bacterium]